MKTLQKKIMRGIYYAYAIRLATLPGLWQGFVMLGSMIVLSHFVSLGNVINNFLQIEVGNIDTFAYNAVRTTELWTFVFIGVFVFCMLSLRFSFTTREHTYSLARV